MESASSANTGTAGGGNQALVNDARALAEQVRDLRRSAVLCGLARICIEPLDTTETIAQKSLLTHLVLAMGLTQLLSLLCWGSIAPLAAFVVIQTLLCGGAFAWLVTKKGHAPLRSAFAICSMLYVVLYFVAEGCLPMRLTDGMVFTMAIPAALFHVPMGGRLFESVVLGSALAAAFFIFSVVDASITAPCAVAGSRSAVVAPDAVAVLLMGILPLGITFGASVHLFLRLRLLDAEALESDKFAESILATLAADSLQSSLSSLATRAEASVTESPFDPRIADIALVYLLHLASSATKRRTNESSAEVREPVERDEGIRPRSMSLLTEQQRVADPLSSSVVDEAAPRRSQSRLTTPRHVPSLRIPLSLEVEDASRLVTPRRTVSRRSSFAVRTPRSVHPEAADGGQLSGVMELHRDSTWNSFVSEPTPKEGGDPKDDDATLMRRRRSSIFRIAKPMTRDRRFVVMMCMPQLGDYLSAPHSQPDMAKLLLREFRDAVRLSVSAFGGRTLGVCFDEIFVAFDRCCDAVAACVRLSDLLEPNKPHYKDPVAVLTRPFDLLSVVVSDEVVVGDVDENCTMGWTTSEALMRLVKAFHRHVAPLPLVLVAEPLTNLIALDFTLTPVPGCGFAAVSSVVERHAETGLPRLLNSDAVEAQLEADGVAFPMPTVNSFMAHVARAAGVPTTAVAAPAARRASRRKELNPEVMQLWHQHDVDNSGTLDIGEVCELLDDLGIVMSDRELQKFYAEIDLDGNGSISLDEFAAACATPNLGGAMVVSGIRRAAAAMRQQTGMDYLPVVVATWNKYDTDGSGNLLGIEIAKVLSDIGIPVSDEEVEWLVEKLDVSGNGVVEIEEFASLFTEDATDLRLNLVKERMQHVARVIENKSSEKMFITPEQLDRDGKVKRSHLLKRVFAPIIFCYVVYNYAQIVYALVLQDAYVTSLAQAISEMVIDVIYLAWFLAKLFVFTWERSGQPVVRRSEVLRSLTRTVGFYIDIVVLLPVDLVYAGLGMSDSVAGNFWWYRINKIAALYHLESQIDIMLNGFSPTTYRVLNIMVWFVLAAHGAGCGMLLTARAIGEANMATMGGSPTLISDAKLRYLLMIMWGMQQLQGNIRGNMLPHTDEQLVLLITTVCASLVLFPTMLAIFADAVMAPTASSTLVDRLGSLRDFFSYARSRWSVEGMDELEEDCVGYYKHLFYTTGSLDPRYYPLTDVPPELAVQLRVSMGLNLLRKVPIFEDACDNAEFVHELAGKLTPRVIEPGVYVTRKGERGSNMYFITHGEFHVIGEHPDQVILTLKRGDFFGEIALVRYVRRASTIRCGAYYANVLVLERRDFDEVLHVFPQCLSAISMAAEDRLRLLLEEQQRQRDQTSSAVESHPS